MGRGRAKAKQTKVARELKYHSPNTDFGALQRELGGGAIPDSPADEEFDVVDDEVDEVEENSDEDDGNWAARRR
jgi:hypothetical protein